MEEDICLAMDVLLVRRFRRIVLGLQAGVPCAPLW